MLGPLKFGLQKTPLAAVKAAVTGTFALTLGVEGTIFSYLLLEGPAGATAYIDWGDGSNSPVTLPASRITDITDHSCENTVTISGSNLITVLNISQVEPGKINSVTGTYPTSLDSLSVGFNFVNPVFTPPNISKLDFLNSYGISNLTTGSNLERLTKLPTNLNGLYTDKSVKLTSLPTLPSNLLDLTTPPGITGLPELPVSLSVLDLSFSTKLMSLPTLKERLVRLTTPPGITVLPTLPSLLIRLDISRSTKLTNLSIPGYTRLTTLTLPPTCTSLNVSGCTGLTSLALPPKLVTLDISKCTKLTSVALPPSLTTLRIERSGLTSLDLTGTNVTTLNIPSSMDAQLKTLKLAGSKVKLAGLLRYDYPEENVWTLY